MSTAALLLKLVLSLGAVVGLILLLQRFARRYGRAFGAAGAEKIRIMSQKPVGPRTSLAVIQVMERTLLIGISPQGVHALADLEPVPSGSTRDPERAAGGFEEELGRRLEDLRRRYPSVLDAQRSLRQGTDGGLA